MYVLPKPIQSSFIRLLLFNYEYLATLFYWNEEVWVSESSESFPGHISQPPKNKKKLCTASLLGGGGGGVKKSLLGGGGGGLRILFGELKTKYLLIFVYYCVYNMSIIKKTKFLLF